MRRSGGSISRSLRSSEITRTFPETPTTLRRAPGGIWYFVPINVSVAPITGRMCDDHHRQGRWDRSATELVDAVAVADQANLAIRGQREGRDVDRHIGQLNFAGAGRVQGPDTAAVEVGVHIPAPEFGHVVTAVNHTSGDRLVAARVVVPGTWRHERFSVALVRG